jgi:hypothetical protein
MNPSSITTDLSSLDLETHIINPIESAQSLKLMGLPISSVQATSKVEPA